MNTIVELNKSIDLLKKGDLSGLSREIILLINEETRKIINIKDNHSQDQIIKMSLILIISNILYNNTTLNILPLEDGIYDILLELYKKYNPDYEIGAIPISFKDLDVYRTNINNRKEVIKGIVYFNDEHNEDFIFKEDLLLTPELSKKDFISNGLIYNTDRKNTIRNTSHLYPELVGTLNKCKFILNNQAKERGVFEDSNVTILERDFFAKHIKNNIISTDKKFTMILELKYDGVSVEAEVSNKIHSSRSRGDTNENLGSDITHILKNYRFPYANVIKEDDIFGMKFEAIMTYENLYRYNMKKNKVYKNCRTAISSIFSSLNGEDFSEYITLIPLATSLHDIDRLVEINFMNNYFIKGEFLRYAVIHGNYIENLFQIKKFTEEAEYMRNILPFMYDGIVVSYLDDEIKDKLGRYNSVNLYSMAVKFSPLKKNTIFRGYTYTVGQDGSITPMIHYDAVEFYGTVHDKSTGHSYDRFKELSLKEDDIISVEYVNDVMPYVYKVDIEKNNLNINPIIEFIKICPSCGTELIISPTRKTIICPNIECPERNISRMIGMLKKLNLRDFAEETLLKIAKYSFKELMELTVEDVSFLGDNNSVKLIERLNDIRIVPIYDYKIIGSLGFSGIAIEKWKLIMFKYDLSELMKMSNESLEELLVCIKGIGLNTTKTIITEMEFYKNDLLYISDMNNIIVSKNLKFDGKKIRFSGFRDQSLVKRLNDMGHEANDNSNVNKTTDILLVPYDGYTSSKTSSCGENTQIISINNFIDNMNKYLE